MPSLLASSITGPDVHLRHLARLAGAGLCRTRIVVPLSVPALRHAGIHPGEGAPRPSPRGRQGLFSLGDIAVLTLRNTDRQRLLRLLGRYGVPVIDLQGYRGATIDRVKVGTYHRAKGLEFKAVLLPMWNQVSLDREAEPGCEIDATGGERRERDRRALFVAMTRARDELWLGSVRGPSGSG